MSNVWCTLNIVIKLRQLYSQQTLIGLRYLSFVKFKAIPTLRSVIFIAIVVPDIYVDIKIMLSFNLAF